MKQRMTFFCAFLALMMAASSCHTNRYNASRDLSPDEVFTTSEDDIVNETWRVNSTISGNWAYNAPSVGVSGRNLLAGIAKPIATSKFKKKLKKAYKKIGINKLRPEFYFSPDGTCAIRVMGTSIKGSYNYNPDTEKITVKWHGIPMSANLKRDGKNKMQLTFDADKLLSLLSLMGRFSDSSAVRDLSKLLDNYEDVMVGFELKK